MSLKYKFQVQVPGTSANLGSGFDLFGLAFKIYNRFSFEFGVSESFRSSVKGYEVPPFSEDEDLVLAAYKNYFSLFIPEISPPPYSVKMELDLPMKGGLGSSASAVVAGYTAARFAQETYFKGTKAPSESDFLYNLALLEGHPDNTTPAYLGGFVFSYFAEERLYYFKKKFPKGIHCFFLIPEFEIATNHSRKCLPEKYPVEDVIFNMSRFGTWWEFLESGKPGLLQKALEDRIHTPYRMNPEFPILPLVEKVEKEVLGVSLSGSGPSILLYCQRKHSKRISGKLESLTRQFSEETGISCRLLQIGVDSNGIQYRARKL
ncbi:homoserine kinase [Leptospira inadai serovar Lyme str. 10]|uniref:Homoserine kinase n=2 Tax=Leptospira inadai serovar Lyme TaxID=293084 RepID=V6HC80_9LEPT|nr:homoserine kinase [Leptospira inadai]EQA37202.1 homoserine kinase [Leptospira inadai serovar Lyme str. 10]PNV76597.1 homoserine kinase [Leptospira inadai serovar Lyme]